LLIAGRNLKRVKIESLPPKIKRAKSRIALNFMLGLEFFPLLLLNLNHISTNLSQKINLKRKKNDY